MCTSVYAVGGGGERHSGKFIWAAAVNWRRKCLRHANFIRCQNLFNAKIFQINPSLTVNSVEISFPFLFVCSFYGCNLHQMQPGTFCVLPIIVWLRAKNDVRHKFSICCEMWMKSYDEKVRNMTASRRFGVNYIFFGWIENDRLQNKRYSRLCEEK